MSFTGLFILCVWLLRLAMGAASAAAVFRIWPERRLKFIKYTAIHLHAAIIDSLFAVAIIFIADDLKVLSWRLNLMWGIAIIAQEASRFPLLLYVLRPGDSSNVKERINGS